MRLDDAIELLNNVGAERSSKCTVYIDGLPMEHYRISIVMDDGTRLRETDHRHGVDFNHDEHNTFMMNAIF